MTEKQAKKQLAKMLGSFTAGSVLHLLADVQGEAADNARQDGHAVRFDQCKQVEQTLNVVGMGVNAALPSSR